MPGPITLKVGVTDAKQAEIEATVAAVYGGATSISMTTGGYIFNDGKFVRMLKKLNIPFATKINIPQICYFSYRVENQ